MINPHKNTRGLSALELLLPIAVIALILALAWPALRAKHDAMLASELQVALAKIDRDAIIQCLKRGANPCPKTNFADRDTSFIYHHCVYNLAIQLDDIEMLRLSATPKRLASQALRLHCPPLLHMAFERRNTEMIDCLLENGARVTDRTFCQSRAPNGPNAGQSPLAKALEINDADLVHRLLARATEDEIQRPGHADNPLGGDPALLCSAVRSGNPEWVTLLHDRGFPVNARALLGQTALHEAARRGDRIMIETLLAAGADPTLKDTSGATPFDKLPASRRAALAPLLADATTE